MPRKKRFQLLGMPQHIIQRGNNRQACFFAEADYFNHLDVVDGVNPGLLAAVEK